MLAQFQPASPGDIGTWLIVLGGVLGLYWLSRQIYLSHWPVQKQEDQYVTHAQFDQFKSEVKVELSSFKNELKADVERSATDTADKVRDLDRYTRDSFHRAQSAQHHMLTDLAWLKGVLGAKPVRRPQEEGEP